VSGVNSEWFLATWARTLRPIPGALDGHRVGGGAPAVFAAIDNDGHPHLLVEIADTTALPAMRRSRALSVAVETLMVGSNPPRRYLALRCVHAAHDVTFASLAAEIATALVEGAADPATVVVRTIERWRSFWSADPLGLGPAEVLGLFGELWFLDRWMSPIDRSVIESWCGPDRARHDMQWPVFSVEIKTSATVAAGGVAHQIAGLEQLADPVQGRLLLFSLHVADDALARNTLPTLVERVRATTVHDPVAAELVDAKLAATGYSPAHAARYTRTLRMVSEGLYAVEGDFPRLTASSFSKGLPAGISHVSYTIALAACAKHLLASSPSESVWRHMRATLL
jgi:hypothetical protein